MSKARDYDHGRTIVCDASALISLSENCLLWLLYDLDADFVIPKSVKEEIVDRPLASERFEFKAMRLAKAVDDGVLRVVEDRRAWSLARKLERSANRLLKKRRKPVTVMHVGEADALGLAMQMKAIYLLDERTTRLVVEDPDSLKRYIEARMHIDLDLDKRVAKDLREDMNGVRIIRSAELLAYAYEKGLLERLGFNGRVLHAGLFALKFAGCAITDDEIRDYLRIMQK
ncbi:MAG: hypothetical protein JW834_00860 [Candidatus Diapherotrites archaeon]|nr:hypothetical protein [Candidatus Diapherotrites archaeon]